MVGALALRLALLRLILAVEGPLGGTTQNVDSLRRSTLLRRLP
jgi:hypothetical protein